MKIYVDLKNNPELVEIFEGFNDIMDDWNRENNRLHKFVVPVIWRPRIQKELLSIGEKLSGLQKKWIVYNVKAEKFAQDPILRIPHDTDKTLTFLHYVGVLRNKLGQLRADMSLITENYNGLHRLLQSQKSYNLAMASFVLGFVGFLISLFAGI